MRKLAHIWKQFNDVCEASNRYWIQIDTAEAPSLYEEAFTQHWDLYKLEDDDIIKRTSKLEHLHWL